MADSRVLRTIDRELGVRPWWQRVSKGGVEWIFRYQTDHGDER